MAGYGEKALGRGLSPNPAWELPRPAPLPSLSLLYIWEGILEILFSFVYTVR